MAPGGANMEPSWHQGGVKMAKISGTKINATRKRLDLNLNLVPIMVSIWLPKWSQVGQQIEP